MKYLALAVLALACTASAAVVEQKARKTLGQAGNVSSYDPREQLKEPLDVRIALDRMQRPPWENTAAFAKPEAWDRWLANAPESENVEDRRDPGCDRHG